MARPTGLRCQVLSVLENAGHPVSLEELCYLGSRKKIYPILSRLKSEGRAKRIGDGIWQAGTDEREPTAEEIEVMIQEQMQCLPAWFLADQKERENRSDRRALMWWTPPQMVTTKRHNGKVMY